MASDVHKRKLGVIKEVIHLKKFDEWDEFFKSLQDKIVNKSISETLINYFQEEGLYIRIWRFVFSVFVVFVVYIYFFKSICVDLINEKIDEETINKYSIYRIYLLINFMYGIDAFISFLQLFTISSKFTKITNILLVIPLKIIMSIPFPLELKFWVSFKFFRLDLINSFFQLVKEFCNKIIESNIHNNILKNVLNYLNEIFKFFLVFILYAHFMTCIFVRIDLEILASGLTYSKIYENFDNQEYYLLCLYTTISIFTNVGYGDIVPHANLTILLTMINMYFGYSLFIIVIYNVRMLFSRIKYYRKSETLRNDFDQFIFYLQRNRGFMVPKNLKYTMYSHIVLRKALSFPEVFRTYEKMFKKCRADIKKEFSLSLFDNLFKEYSVFFKNCSHDFVIKIFSKLTPKTFKPGKQIINVNDKVKNLFFILSGEINISNKDDIKFFEIKSSSIIGDYAFFNNITSDFNYQVSDIGFAVGFYLSKKDFNAIAKEEMTSAREFIIKSYYKHFVYKEIEKIQSENYFRQSKISNELENKNKSFSLCKIYNLAKSNNKMWDTIKDNINLKFGITSSHLNRMEIKSNILKKQFNIMNKNLLETEFSLLKFKSNLTNQTKELKEKILQMIYGLRKIIDSNNQNNHIQSNSLKNIIKSYFNETKK